MFNLSWQGCVWILKLPWPVLLDAGQPVDLYLGAGRGISQLLQVFHPDTDYA